MPSDLTAPLLISSPPSATVAANGSLTLQFNEAISLGYGKIYITDGESQSFIGRDGQMHTRIVGGTDTRVIEVPGPEVSVSGSTLTIDPASNLAAGTHYKLVLDGAVRDLSGNLFTGLADSTQFAFTVAAPGLTISFSEDTGISDSDLITRDGDQTISVQFSGDYVAGDHVEVFVNGAWHPATYNGEAGAYFVSDEVTGVLSGAGTITARLLSSSNVLKASQESAYLIDNTPPTWSVAGATLSLDVGSDTGDVGDGTTQFNHVTVNVDLHNMSGLQVGDIISIHDSFNGEGVWIDPTSLGSHVITAADLAGSGHIAVAVNLAQAETDWFSLRAVVMDAAGNRPSSGRYSTDVLELEIDTSAAYFYGAEPSPDLTKLYLHFDEPVRPDRFKLVKVSDGSELIITHAMMDLDPDSSDITVNLPSALEDGAEYRLESLGYLYDSAGNITFSDPLATFQADATVEFESFGISNDSGQNDHITNVANQTVSGTFEGILKAGAKIQVSTNGGDTWTDATVSGHDWSLAVTLAEGENHLFVRAVDGSEVMDSWGEYYTLDSAAPVIAAAPSLESEDDSGVLGDNVTAFASVNIAAGIDGMTGLREGDKVEFLDGATVIGSFTIHENDFDMYGAIDGDHSIGVNLAGGSHSITTRITDIAGNVGSLSTARTIVIDLTPPPAPPVPDLSAASDDGASSTDNITTHTTLTVRAINAGATGYHVGDEIEVLDGDTIVGSHTVVAGDFDSYGVLGDVHITLDPLAAGNHSLSVRAMDPAGNIASGAGALAVTIVPDTDPPTALLDMGSVLADMAGGTASVDLTSTDGATYVQYSINGGGTWFTGTQSGVHSSFTSPYGAFGPLMMRVVDASGNVGVGIAGASAPGTIVTVGSNANDVISTDDMPALFTRDGDDNISTSTGSFTWLDGGAGSDTFTVLGNLALSLTGLAGKLHNVERIWLHDNSSLDVSDISGLAGFGVTTLRIDGTAANVLTIGNLVWAATGSITGYQIYATENFTLEVADAMVASVVGVPDFAA